MQSPKPRRIRRLGVGGAGCVDLMDCGPDLGRRVRKRILHLDDPGARRRGLREARALARLAHPRVLPVLDLDVRPEALDLWFPDLGGRSLDRYLDRNAPLTVEEALDLLDQLLEALEYLHGQGVAHRDIKPANLLMCEDRGLVVLDFGLCRDLGGDATRSQVVAGTPAYGAPELFLGQVTEREADLFAAALVAMTALTGRCPNQGRPDLMTLAERRLGRWDLDQLEDLPAEAQRVRPLLARMLARAPQDRPSARRARRELRRLRRPVAPRLDAGPPREGASPSGARAASPSGTRLASPPRARVASPPGARAGSPGAQTASPRRTIRFPLPLPGLLAIPCLLAGLLGTSQGRSLAAAPPGDAALRGFGPVASATGRARRPGDAGLVLETRLPADRLLVALDRAEEEARRAEQAFLADPVLEPYLRPARLAADLLAVRADGWWFAARVLAVPRARARLLDHYATALDATLDVLRRGWAVRQGGPARGLRHRLDPLRVPVALLRLRGEVDDPEDPEGGPVRAWLRDFLVQAAAWIDPGEGGAGSGGGRAT